MKALRIIKKIETDKIVIDDLGDMKGKTAEIIVLFQEDEAETNKVEFKSLNSINIDTIKFKFDREFVNER